MRLLALTLLLAGLGVPAALAEPGPGPGELAARLRAEPVQTLAGAPAVLDAERVRAALDEDRYVLLVPGDSAVEPAEVAEELGPAAEVVVVRGLRVELADWERYATAHDWNAHGGAEWDGDTLAGWVNGAAEDYVMVSQDVTYPVLGALGVMEGRRLGPAPEAAGARVDESSVVRELRAERVFVHPDVVRTGREIWDPFPDGRPPGGVGYRVAYLPAGTDSGLQYRLAKEFPDDVVVVATGFRVDAEGPGSDADITLARVAAHALLRPGLATSGPYPPVADGVRALFDDLLERRGGTLDTPVAAGLTVGAWAFALTGAGIAALSIGAWWWLRRRRLAAQARAFAAGSARAAGELVRLAELVAGAGGAVAERYTTALGMVERATGPAEVVAAREVIAEGLRLAGDPLTGRPLPGEGRVPTPAGGSRRADGWLIGMGVFAALLTGTPARSQSFLAEDPYATTVGAYAGAGFAVVLGLYLLVRGRPESSDGLSWWRAGRWLGGAMVLVTVLGLGINLDGSDLTITVALAVALLVIVVAPRLVPARPRLSPAITRAGIWCGVVTSCYTLFAMAAEDAGAPSVFRAAVYIGYGGLGVLLAFWLFVLLSSRRAGIERRRATVQAAAGTRARALADLLRLAAVVTSPDIRADIETLGVRYAEAKEAFETGAYEQVIALVAETLPSESRA